MRAALVVMRVPERQLLAAMRRAERIVDVENLHPARLHGLAELIKQSHTEPGRGAVSKIRVKTSAKRSVENADDT
jgi:hypothetical protein